MYKLNAEKRTYSLAYCACVVTIMCLIFVVQNQHPNFPLIIAANRDEFYTRPSLQAHYWPEYPNILAGKDIEAGGTWLGLTSKGYFATITNIRDNEQPTSARSRGLLVKDALIHAYDKTQLSAIYHHSYHHTYAGFNLLAGYLFPQAQLFYINNRHNKIECLRDGIHGLSNAFLNTPWPKVTQGITTIEHLLDNPFNSEDWFTLLHNEEKANLDCLPHTGISLDNEQLLSSRFIRSTHYGTRTSTIITVSPQGHIQFFERNYHLSHTENQYFKIIL